MTSKDGDSDVCPDMLLYKCVAHFMGRKAPGSTVDVVENVQKPLVEIYTADPRNCMTKDIARDVYLMVFTSGILAIPVNPIDSKIWIPIQNFRSGTAVKGVGSAYGVENAACLTFEPLDSAATASSPLPAIFAVIASRGNCVPLLDCYMFSCPSNDVALTLLEKTRQAFADRRGWSNNLKPPPVSMLDLSDNFAGERWKCKREECSQDFRENVNPELYQKPPLGGFYYAPQKGVIRQFDIGLEAEAYPLPDLNIGPENSKPCQDLRYLLINQEESPIVEPGLGCHPSNINGMMYQMDDIQPGFQSYQYGQEEIMDPYGMQDVWMQGYPVALPNEYGPPPTGTFDATGSGSYPAIVVNQQTPLHACPGTVPQAFIGRPF